jgi:predicted acetyltransferase
MRVDDQLAGFALVCEHSWLGNHGKMIAEFFVMRKYRGQGVGRAAAYAVFDAFPGHWEVSQLAQNLPAQKFWRQVIGEYTRGKYREVILDNTDWQGPVQMFDNAWAADGQAER